MCYFRKVLCFGGCHICLFQVEYLLCHVCKVPLFSNGVMSIMSGFSVECYFCWVSLCEYTLRTFLRKCSYIKNCKHILKTHKINQIFRQKTKCFITVIIVSALLNLLHLLTLHKLLVYPPFVYILYDICMENIVLGNVH